MPIDRRIRLRADALLLGALVVIGLLRFAGSLRMSLLPDEIARAIGLVQSGHSPYEDARYLYPPTLAEVGARAATRYGMYAVLVSLRVASIVGAAVLAFASARLVVASRLGSAALAVAILTLAPWITSGIELGNPSPLIASMVFGSLLLLHGHRVCSGVMLGVSLAIKPMGLGSLFVVARDSRARLVVLGAAALSVVIVALTPTYVGAMLRQEQALDITAGSNFSVHRAVGLFGLRLPPVVVSGFALAGFVAWSHREREGRGICWIALTASVFVLPRVWMHTLCMLIPVIVIAISRAKLRPLETESRDARARRWFRNSTIMLATTGLLVADALSYTPYLPRPAQALLALMPFASACTLLHFSLDPGAMPATRPERELNGDAGREV